MATFAVIAEGITDQAVLDLILNGHYGEEVDVNPLQPLRDQTDSARVAPGQFGGWELVLEYCADRERIVQALSYNDYLVIQIDTDCCELPNFDVARTEGGEERPACDLVADVTARIVTALGPDLVEANKGRIFFAICVHSLECWLLPLHENRDKARRRTLNCADHLNRALAKAKIAYAKEFGAYDRIARGYLKRGAVAAHVGFNESFEIFVSSLPIL